MKGVRGIFRKKEKNNETASVEDEVASATAAADDNNNNDDDNDNNDDANSTNDWQNIQTGRAARRAQRREAQREVVAPGNDVARPSYRVYNGENGDDDDHHDDDDDDVSDDDHSESSDPNNRGRLGQRQLNSSSSQQPHSKAKHIELSAGTNRLNRILSRHDIGTHDNEDPAHNFLFNRGGHTTQQQQQHFTVERVGDPKNLTQVANFVSRVVVPPLKVDKHSIGGHVVAENGYYPSSGKDNTNNHHHHHHMNSMQQETLLVFKCQNFESTGAETVQMNALQYPADFKKHKRSWGGFYGAAGSKGRHKLRYCVIARSTNKPLSRQAQQRQKSTRGDLPHDDDGNNNSNNNGANEERGDYDAMFSPAELGTDEEDLSIGAGDPENITASTSTGSPLKATSKETNAENNNTTTTTAIDGSQDPAQQTEEQPQEPLVEISSFPVLICMSLHSSGTAPDMRKLIRLDQLTTVQDLHTTVVQLAFRNGDTVRLDFGTNNNNNNNSGGASRQSNDLMSAASTTTTTDDNNDNSNTTASLDKERFIWSLLQIHAMLCVSVVEQNALHMERTFLPPLQVRNLDRAELQYVATVNGFLRQSEALTILLERHRQSLDAAEHQKESPLIVQEEKVDLEEVDSMAYDLMMGNFATRITLFQSEEERRDAEEILNSTEWIKDESAVLSVAERLSLRLQGRMRDLEAETCRRLIAWEDEKQYSARGQKAPPIDADERDSVDALALASLFQTLESLDTELKQMEEWLQERAAAIKPLTDDCADIEEENRQLEQQWKSYEMLGSEIRRLLIGLDIDQDLERVLRNPAQALVYDEEGLVDVEESEHGVEQIYEAGKALQEAIEYPRKTGGMHLRPVNERAKGLTTLSSTFCKALAQIIVTVMEQFKTEVVAGSDHGKVSKSDTHATIARKIRDTQRKFQSALLGYLKLIEVMAALSPEMLPALRDAYSEMVAEGILMKKRMKGYFQALPGKNAAYMHRVGKDLKDYYTTVDGPVKYESVNAPDIKAALTELLPVIAREAYFTSALFGTSTKDQDGREKKRNFENAKSAVDHSSQHFRYYINRTCGILEKEGEKTDNSTVRGDPLLCLVSSIYLNEVMDNYIDREKKGGDHSLSLAYVRATILDLRKKADKQWVIWVEKQIEWIRSHDGVPLHGKRAGVFPSFARFPLYLDHVLSCCREGRSDDYTPDMASIKVINYYMQKMASALLESLRECAGRETTDKQYASTVMQMENTYHFTQSIKERGPAMEDLLSKQITKANAICKESTDGYLGWMIKREFTILHELFSRVSKMRKDVGDSEVAKNIPKHQFVRTLQKEANRDILKEKIGSMYTRMEKHLSEDGKLLPVAWKALVKVLYEWFGRWEKLSSVIYRHKLDPSPVDVVRIAKAAGGGGRPKTQQGGSEFAFKSILALGNKGKEADA